jgi:hypothetical protein
MPKKKKKSSRKVGAPSYLTDDLVAKIRELFFKNEKIKDIQKKCGIAQRTWEHWLQTNYCGFADKMQIMRHDRMLARSEDNLEGILGMDIDPENPKTLRIIASVSKFTAETLGSKHYAKRKELSDPDGKPLGLNFYLPRKNGLEAPPETGDSTPE